MARRAVIESREPVVNDKGDPIVDPTGKPIRRVVWHWEDIPPASPPDPNTGDRDRGYTDEDARALYEQHRQHGALGRLSPIVPKRYRLHFDYADGEEREVEATAAEAPYNEAIGRTLHTAPLLHCSTSLIRET